MTRPNNFTVDFENMRVQKTVVSHPTLPFQFSTKFKKENQTFSNYTGQIWFHVTARVTAT